MKRPVRIALEDRRLSALRGGKVVLTGQAQDDAGRGVSGLRVELWIQHAQRKQRMLLAVQVTDNDGNFRADFGVPPDLAVGDYKLVAHSDGDTGHLPASSDGP
jgi:5-hydroxyisourate hydrolase-like protein (transthyretin family)